MAGLSGRWLSGFEFGDAFYDCFHTGIDGLEISGGGSDYSIVNERGKILWFLEYIVRFLEGSYHVIKSSDVFADLGCGFSIQGVWPLGIGHNGIPSWMILFRTDSGQKASGIKSISY